MDVGGSDVTRAFAWLLHRSAFPYRSCKIDDRMDALLVEELKVLGCACVTWLLALWFTEQDLCGGLTLPTPAPARFCLSNVVSLK